MKQTFKDFKELGKHLKNVDKDKLKKSIKDKKKKINEIIIKT